MACGWERTAGGSGWVGGDGEPSTIMVLILDGNFDIGDLICVKHLFRSTAVANKKISL